MHPACCRDEVAEETERQRGGLEKTSPGDTEKWQNENKRDEGAPWVGRN